MGSTNSFTDTRFGTVSWVINDLVEDLTGSNGIHASMKITYTFNDVTNASIVCALIQARNELNSDENFSVNLIGQETDTSVSVSIVRTDQEAAWSNAQQFCITYLTN